MEKFLSLQGNLQNGLRSVSMGVKLLLVCGLALLMMIPALFVGGVVRDRTTREAEVIADVSGRVGGAQTFLGPVLAIPYTVPSALPAQASSSGIYVVFPARASADVKATTEERHRSLFKVPVFQAALKFDAFFDLTGVPAAAPSNATLDWNQAEIVVGVSDPRGALTDAELEIGGNNSVLVPAEIAQHIAFGSGGSQLKLALFGARVGEIAKPNSQFNAVSVLHFSGAQRLALLAYGKTTKAAIDGGWPNPGFDGGFLPVQQNVTASGFHAEWSVPFIARGVSAEGTEDSISGLDATELGVSFVEVADPYQSITRSLKYIPLFLGLVFLSYFILEAATGKRVHAAQYVLVGIAQIIFYLLLLSLAESIGFDLGFLVAGIATVSLLSINAGWIFASRRQGWTAFAIFSPLYLLIYLLLRLEDNALLVGAFASFAAVAAAMYFTRSVDWYSPFAASTRVVSQAGPAAPRSSNAE
jgi:inner membrane protein